MRNRLLRIIAVIVGCITLLCTIVMWFIFTPATITPHIVGAMQLFTKSEVKIKSVDISLFTRFPNITLKIDSLRIAQTKEGIDDLLFARECRIAVNPFSLITKREIRINHASLRGAQIYMYVDSLHGSLKTFKLPEHESESEEEVSTTEANDYSLTLRRLIIDSTQLIIDDRRKEFYSRVENFGIKMSMELAESTSNLDVVTGFSNLIVWEKGNVLVKNSAVELRSKMKYERASKQLTFDHAGVRVNNIDLRTSGFIRRDTLTNGAYMEIKSTLNTPSISEFLALIPDSFIDTKDKITTEGSVHLDIDVNGYYTADTYPTIGASLKIDNAKAKYESRKLELERVDCDAYAHVDLNAPEESYAEIKRVHINTSDIIDLTLSGRLTNLTEETGVDLNILSDIDFDRFTEIFPLNEGVICHGTNSSDINATFKLADIQENNFANIYIDGESRFKDLNITIDASRLLQDSTNLASLYIKAESGLMLFGDKVLTESNSRTLRSNINFQNLNYQSKSGESITIKDVELTAGANFDRNTSKMNGLGIRGIARETEIKADSIATAKLESADIIIIVKPKTEERNGTVNATINSHQIEINEPITNSDLTLSAVDMKIILERDREKRELRLDSDINSQRITLSEPTYNSNLALSSVQSQISMMRGEGDKRDLSGVIDFSNFHIHSDIYPLDVTIHETSLSMNERTIYLDNARLTVGESDITATGNIHNVLYKMFVDPRATLSGKLSISAPQIDFGAMIEASNQSVLMLEEEEEEEAEVEEKEVVTEESGSMFIVPRRVDFEIDLNIDRALLWGGVVDNFESHATLRNGLLTLNKIEVDAIGAKAMGAMTYRNINRTSSNIAGNMSLKRVDINRIGELFPSINTMMPMLESFEGVVDFDIKANANINNESEIDISTLYSAMRFSGKNLVLMDSETFAELSKKMMFKNKDRNLIDSLELYALVSESTIDLLPFQLSIDRYSAIIGGSQTIDPETFALDYDYHISVMKSPLPFKAGIDITGNLDDFDFSITKAKLKKTNFDDQRTIYEEYCSSIDASQEALASEIEARRAEMRQKRHQQREERDREAKENAAHESEDEGEESVENTEDAERVVNN